MKCHYCGVVVAISQRPSPEGRWGDDATGLLIERETGADHSPDRCASARLAPAEREVLRGLVALGEGLDPHWQPGVMGHGGIVSYDGSDVQLVARMDAGPPMAFACAARNALPIIARLLGEG